LGQRIGSSFDGQGLGGLPECLLALGDLSAQLGAHLLFPQRAAHAQRRALAVRSGGR